MKTFEEFYEFYRTHLLTDLTQLEEKRAQTAQKVKNILIPYAVVAAVLIWLCVGYGDAVFWVGTLLFLIGFGIYYSLTKAYVSDFKDVVIERLVKFLDSNLQYSKTGYIPSGEFHKSKIFLHRADSYEGDDLVSGRLGQTEVRFSELIAQYETRDSKGRRSYHTFFKGLFFIADFNKNFRGQTFVLTDTSERMFGGLGQMLQKMNLSRPELIKMEDPDFERHYVVYGTDQIESRYILSTSLMKRIMDFKQKTNRNIQLSFVDSNVYLAIPYTKNLFEPNVFQTLLDMTPIQAYFEDLQLATGIVDDLNLNLRIWSKG